MSTGPQNAGQGQGQSSGQAAQVDPDVQQMAAQVGPNVEAAVRGHFQAQGGGAGQPMAGMAPGVAAGGGGLGQWINIALTLLPVILQALKDAGLIKQPTP
jgi:hypothetical protein